MLKRKIGVVKLPMSKLNRRSLAKFIEGFATMVLKKGPSNCAAVKNIGKSTGKLEPAK